MNSTNNTDLINRQPRHTSHALVEVRKYRWWPFGIVSGVLLDMSIDGFKLEFTSDFRVKNLQKLWLTIPLVPLGVLGQKSLSVPVEVRWFDGTKFRIGGVFVNLSQEERKYINNVIGILAERGLNKV